MEFGSQSLIRRNLQGIWNYFPRVKTNIKNSPCTELIALASCSANNLFKIEPYSIQDTKLQSTKVFKLSLYSVSHRGIPFEFSHRVENLHIIATHFVTLDNTLEARFLHQPLPPPPPPPSHHHHHLRCVLWKPN